MVSEGILVLEGVICMCWNGRVCFDSLSGLVVLVCIGGGLL